MLKEVMKGDAEASDKDRQIANQATGDIKHGVNTNDSITYYVPKNIWELCRDSFFVHSK